MAIISYFVGRRKIKLMNMEQKFEVRAIENGTVIDHLPSDTLFKIIYLLGLEKRYPSHDFRQQPRKQTNGHQSNHKNHRPLLPTGRNQPHRPVRAPDGLGQYHPRTSRWSEKTSGRSASHHRRVCQMRQSEVHHTNVEPVKTSFTVQQENGEISLICIIL